MNALTLAMASASSRPLQSALCMTAVACGIALLSCVFLLFSTVQGGLKKNADGIDMVVGAKGSPLQLVLSTVYHNDIPVGNVTMADIAAFQKSPDVRKAIPMAIGDNYKGWRIVGSTKDFVKLYGGDFRTGRIFEKPYEAVAGSMTGMKDGEEFAARHGFSVDSDDVHDDHHYRITGILKPTGTVLDRLIVTPYQGVQESHEHHHHEHEEDGHHDDGHDEEEHEEHMENQITALLVHVKNPAAMMNLPHRINQGTNMMAASPGHVMAKFMQGAGMGRDVLVILGYLFLSLAGLMLLSVLISGLADRKYDLAVLRVLGAPASTLSFTVLWEAFILSALGSMAGLVVGHVLAYAIMVFFPALQTLALPSSVLLPSVLDAALLGLGIFAGLLAGIIPCILAAKTDIAGLLAQGR